MVLSIVPVRNNDILTGMMSTHMIHRVDFTPANIIILKSTLDCSFSGLDLLQQTSLICNFLHWWDVFWSELLTWFHLLTVWGSEKSNYSIFHQKESENRFVHQNFVSSSSSLIMWPPLRLIGDPLEGPDPLVGPHWTKLTVYKAAEAACVGCGAALQVIESVLLFVRKLVSDFMLWVWCLASREAGKLPSAFSSVTSCSDQSLCILSKASESSDPNWAELTYKVQKRSLEIR